VNALSSARVGPYQLLAKIGQGGMGSVHLAKMDGPSGFRKLAVVKELRTDLLSSPELVQLFLAEARLAARLQHPNVVHTYGADEDRGRLYIAMEYLDGQPWVRVRHRLWQNRSLPLATHLRVLAETLAALHYAHEASDYDGTPLHVVHCDVSPHNVFVTYEGQVKIVDFGVARAVTSKDIARKESFAGKLSYAAPEQLSGEDLDRRVDIFAVGVMLWEALAGRPFVEDQDRGAVLRRRIMGNEPRVREVVPTVPRALADVCDRATATSREERFTTAAEFRHALVDYLAKNSPETDDAQLARLVATAFREERAQVQSLIERCLKATPPPPPAAARSTVPPKVPSQAPVRRSTSPSQPVAQSQLITPVAPPPGRASSTDLRASSPDLRASVPDLSQLGVPESAGVGENTMRADLSELASVSKITDDRALIEASFAASVRPRYDANKRRMVLAGLGVGVALLGWLFLWLLTPSAAPAAETPADGTPATVLLDIHVLPTGSELYLDGEKLGSNPYRARRQRDQAQHTVRASAPGHKPQQWIIRLDSDTHIAYQLPAGPGAAPTTPPASAAPVLPPAVVAPVTEVPAPQPGPRSAVGGRRKPSRASTRAPAPAAADEASEAAASEAGPEADKPKAPAASKPAAGKPARSEEPELDERLTPIERGTRKIYEEDPYK
jgi:eukaryotic-like serine/threonine-protein kinase